MSKEDLDKLFPFAVKALGVFGAALQSRDPQGPRKTSQQADALPVDRAGLTSTEAVNKLLSKVVDILTSIDGTLKEHLKFDQDVFIDSRRAEREKVVEQQPPEGGGAFQKIAGVIVSAVSPLGSLVAATFTSAFFALKDTVKGIIDKISSFVQFFKTAKDAKSGSPQAPSPGSQAGGKPAGPPPNIKKDSSFDVAFNYAKTPKPLTSMTIEEVIAYQKGTLLPQEGASPVGAYQINVATLRDFAPKVLGPDWENQKFDPGNQYKIAEALFEERKSRSDLSKTWAGLRGRMPAEGYANKSFAEVEKDIRIAEGTYRGDTPGMPDAVAYASNDNKAPAPSPSPTVNQATDGDPQSNKLFDIIMQLADMDKNQTYYAEIGDLAYKTQTINTDSAAIDTAMTFGEAAMKEVNDRISMQVDQPNQTQPILAQGRMEALDPNYRLGEANLVTNYLMSFGLRAA